MRLIILDKNSHLKVHSISLAFLVRKKRPKTNFFGNNTSMKQTFHDKKSYVYKQDWKCSLEQVKKWVELKICTWIATSSPLILMLHKLWLEMKSTTQWEVFLGPFLTVFWQLHQYLSPNLGAYSHLGFWTCLIITIGSKLQNKTRIFLGVCFIFCITRTFPEPQNEAPTISGASNDSIAHILNKFSSIATPRRRFFGCSEITQNE